MGQEKSALNNNSIEFLALGDSYTICQGVKEYERWPLVLAEQLKQNGFNVNRVDIVAKTGWTTKNLSNAINKSDLKDYNLVSLLIGVNNQFQNIPFHVFKLEFDALLQKAIDIAKNKQRMFVVSIPDYGVTPFGKRNSDIISKEINNYNNYIKDACKQQGILFINITDISRKLGDSPKALASDNLHPGAYQYKKWVDKILPEALLLLNK
ncbi:SGNH/GDSL hydrolase family protein [Flavobacteriaceae bacterium]|nr:SGNH/GDSL hydrolase family protein [Flavobacteriaceae bacterium]